MPLREWQARQDELSRMMEMASLITTPDGSPLTEMSRCSSFCQLIRSTKKGRENCRHLHGCFFQKSRVSPETGVCSYCQLHMGNTRIVMGGVHVGNWLYGQVRHEGADMDKLQEYLSELNLNVRRALTEYSKLPALSEEEFQARARFIDGYVKLIIKKNPSLLPGSGKRESFKVSREELARKEEVSRITLDSLEEGVITIDSTGRLLTMNRRAEELTGRKYGDTLGKEIDGILHFSRLRGATGFSEMAIRAMEQEKEFHLEKDVLLASRNDQIHHVRVHFSPVKKGSRGIAGIITIRDRTEENTLQEQLFHSQRLENFSLLTGGIVHDLNNMINGITVAASMLGEGSSDEDEKKELIRLIEQAAQRSMELTGNLKNFVRKDENRTGKISLSSLIEDTVSILSVNLNKGIELTMDLSREGETIFGNASSLQSALMNLGINAIHSIKGSGRITFDLSSLSLDESYCRASDFDIMPGKYGRLGISDTGSGIPRDIRGRIFDPFFTTKEHGLGTGLGLSSVMRTVIDHNGEITFESEEGRGTTFTILLPLDYGEGEETSGKDFLPKAKGRESILVVDDDEINRHLLVSMLSSLGYEIHTAENGKEAVDFVTAGETGVDLVLLDLVMPVLDGYSTFNQLREKRENQRIIVVSGYAESEKLQNMWDRGLNGFIRKPYGINELSQGIRRVLDGEDG